MLTVLYIAQAFFLQIQLFVVVAVPLNLAEIISYNGVLGPLKTYVCKF